MHRRRPESWPRASSSTPASIPTRPRTSATCATPFSATPLCACCAPPGYKVDVQNYIDNTGVQVADVVVGFLHLEEQIARRSPRARRDASVAPHRRRTAHRLLLLGSLRPHLAVVRRRHRPRRRPRANKLRSTRCTRSKHGGNETAEIAELISTAVLRRHLETMLRLGIEYDFLPRESEILHLKFWEAAFEKLKQTGVLYFETEGKNKGCWVMTRARRGRPSRRRDGRGRQGHRPLQRHRHLRRQGHRLPPLEVRPARPRLRLQAVLHLSRSRVLDLGRARRAEPSALRRRARPSTTSSTRASPTRRPT